MKKMLQKWLNNWGRRKNQNNMRIMLDTNILISIVIFKSNKLKQMLMDICDKHTLVLSSYIIQELENVTERKFPNKKKAMAEFLFNIPYELEYTPSAILNEKSLNIRDIKDAPVLYSAIIADVDILITGDRDFENIDIEKPEIMKPSEFISSLW